MSTTKLKRLVSIDLLRGMTVMLMIFVNNGAGDSIFSTLQHSKWNGMTLADCVFPSFIFIMGMSTYLSLRKFNFQWSKTVAKKITKRGALLFLIGIAINWFDMALDGRPLDFGHLRIWGVMQRLGIVYFLTAAVVLSLPVRKEGSMRGAHYTITIIIGGLIAYSALLLIGNGYGNEADSFNIISYVDNSLFGWDHLYHKSPVDPEGLVSTFSATLQCLLGFVVMEYLAKASTIKNKITILSFVALAGLIVGLALTPWLPLNKRIWSTSYVLVTTGISTAVLALLITIVDRKKESNLTDGNKGSALQSIIKAFGMNPLILYVGSEALSIIFGASGIKDGTYNVLHSVIISASWAGFVYALLFTAIFAVIGMAMYKRMVFIKL